MATTLQTMQPIQSGQPMESARVNINNAIANISTLNEDKLDNVANSITTNNITNASVTKAKFENVTAKRVLGNMGASASAPAEVAVLDEDNMVSDNNVSLATQQSIKAYADSDKVMANTLVIFVATETATEIQAKIDAVPKNLNGKTVTFQFADGTYSLDAQLTITNFFGGRLIFQGNSAENFLSRHTNQAAILVMTDESTSSLKRIFHIINGSAEIFIRNLRFNHPNSGVPAITVYNASSRIQGCFFASNSPGTSRGVSSEHHASVQMNYCVIGAHLYGAYSIVSGVLIVENSSSETDAWPQYALAALRCGTTFNATTNTLNGVIDETLVEADGLLIPIA